jgi:DNA-binding MarR family transcriptional regulator
MPTTFCATSEETARRVTAGLVKIGLVLKSRAWKGTGPERLTPTQAQILALLQAHPEGLRLSALAEKLGVTAPTASDAVTALVGKGFVLRGAGADHHRALALRLTPEGEAVAARIADWPDFLMRAVDVLSPHEQAVFLRGLVKMIRALQEAGDIPVQRMCVTCLHFRPNAHPDDPQNPHHCAFVDAPFGDRQLRLECGEHAQADAEIRAATWARFLNPLPRSRDHEPETASERCHIQPDRCLAGRRA